MRRAAIALPVIATVPSGAALARSSNLLHLSQEPWTDASGNAYCLDTSALDYDPLTGTADVGTSTPHVTRITNRSYFKDAEATTPVSITEMCTEGGEYYYVDGTTSQTIATGRRGRRTTNYASTTKVSLPQGAFTSASAMTSFAGNLTVDEI
jgi:hypothetical protein